MNSTSTTMIQFIYGANDTLTCNCLTPLYQNSQVEMLGHNLILAVGLLILVATMGVSGIIYTKTKSKKVI